MAFKTTSGSTREKWVAAFLPTMAIILASFMYITFYASPEAETVERQYKAAMSNVTPLQFCSPRAFLITLINVDFPFDPLPEKINALLYLYSPP